MRMILNNDLRTRQYRLLRRQGYTAKAALWNVRACSNYFWQKQLFWQMEPTRCIAAPTPRRMK